MAASFHPSVPVELKNTMYSISEIPPSNNKAATLTSSCLMTNPPRQNMVPVGSAPISHSASSPFTFPRAGEVYFHDPHPKHYNLQSQHHHQHQHHHQLPNSKSSGATSASAGPNSPLATSRRESLVYPLTPQTLISNNGRSPSLDVYHNQQRDQFLLSSHSLHHFSSYLPSHNSAHINAAAQPPLSHYQNFSTRPNVFFSTPNIATGSTASDSNGKMDCKLYYEKKTKFYVKKNEYDGADGVSQGLLLGPFDVTPNHSGKDESNSGTTFRVNKSDKTPPVSSSSEHNNYNHFGDDDDDDDHHENDDDNDDANNANSTDDLEDGKHKRTSVLRSRTGCLTCRTRKKKCCETKPTCKECDRLKIACRWPLPGSERKNKSKSKTKRDISHDEYYHEVYGVIKVLRGVVDYKIDES